jgi:hypothetical protein
MSDNLTIDLRLLRGPLQIQWQGEMYASRGTQLSLI